MGDTVMPKHATRPVAEKSRIAFDAIHVGMLSRFNELVIEIGGDPVALLAHVGLAPSEVSRATYRQFVPLLEIAASELECPDFGMRLAVRQSAGALTGPLGDGIRNSGTFGEALKFVCKHSYAHSLAAWIWLKRSLHGERVVVGHDILLDGLPKKSQATEYLLLVGLLAMYELTNDRIRAQRVVFRHDPLSLPKVYRQYFGCEVGFGRSADAIIYRQQDLSCVIGVPNPMACKAAADAIKARFPCRKPPMYADVRGIISHVLGTEVCTRDHVAGLLHLHPRTMVRRLAAEGTSFQQIRDEVRRERLLDLTQQSDLDFMAISEKLGFSEQAVMTRYCHKWFAMSPTHLRAGAAPN